MHSPILRIKMTKLIFVTEYFPKSAKGEISGGVEARAFYLSRELAKNGLDVKVITSWQRGLKRHDEITGVEVERVGPHHAYSHKGSLLSRYQFAMAAFKKLKNEKADFVDGFNFTTYLPAYFGAKKASAKAVATYHETWIGDWIRNKGLCTGIVGEILERITLKCKWDLIIPVSNFTKDKLLEKGMRTKMQVVYNGVDIANIANIEAQKADRFRIICVARLVPTKRIETLVRAISRMQDPDVECVIIGDGPNRQNLWRLAADLGVNGQVTFKGFMEDSDDLIREIKKSHVMCLPSAVEGFGIMVIESMAAGVPVVCSDITPFKELTSNGKYGLNFKLDDYEDLSEKIFMLKFDTDKYESIKALGLERASEFGWDKIEEEYVRCLESRA